MLTKEKHASTKDYKIEMRPTLWVVTLESGEYSDYTIDYLFFRANDEFEVWNYLCRYIEDIYKSKRYINELWWKKKKYFVKKHKSRQSYWKEVNIERMNVIEFSK